MKYQPLQNISSILKKTPDFSELSTILGFLDQPAMLISGKTFEITTINNKVLEFTKYPVNELIPSNLDDFFPGLSSILVDLESDSRVNCSLINRNGSYTPVQAEISILSPSRSWYLIFLYEVSNNNHPQPTRKNTDAFALNLVKPLSDISTKQSIKRILTIASNDLNLTSSSLYIKLKKDNFEFNKYLGFNADKMPEYIFSDPGNGKLEDIESSFLEKIKNPIDEKISVMKLPDNNPEGFLVVSHKQSQLPDEKSKSKLDYLLNIISLALRLDNYSHRVDYLSRKIKSSDNLDTDLINFLNDAVIFTDHRINIISMNTVSEGLFGYSSEEAKNLNLSKVFNTNLQPIFDLLEARKSITDSVSLNNFSAYNRIGEKIPLYLTIVPNLASKNLYDYAFLITDISENEILKEKIAQLEHQANLGDISSIFAHEVLNPVNNISTRLQLMRQDLPETDLKTEEINKMLISCDRITELMNSIKEYSKQTGYMVESININSLLSDLIHQRNPRMEKAQIELQLDLGDVPNIKGDKRSLEQAFTNLFSNSIRAMKTQGGGVLGIKTVFDHSINNQKFIDIYVSDTGPGIPEDIRDNIFKPFFTTHRTGTGLGLALVKKTVAFHKGHISLESFPGGTIFKISLPAA